MPRSKDDDIRDVTLAIIALIIFEGAIFFAVPQPSAPAAQLAQADDTWKW